MACIIMANGSSSSISSAVGTDTVIATGDVIHWGAEFCE
ncbi:predicted protein [Sclerotinia sclerotiorum 1980 UF-70]|uniref:Uncharacterized protein n=1 Tax=Sclerotinia sclerotiorum (strain ATCC 18683 / 1980 / Ss-1) TaxID=665079 RepID=A7F8B3_SCLS1|nr:predicted protein [Sclerotinia sclerotiorum 1980 UF-70]EDN98984.1 predicted protein [Sclerotinia sclerotiorum 1980 UF-70]